MEEECTVKPSVAELAGRFKGHALPMLSPNDEKRPIRRMPPCSLNFQNKKDEESQSEKPVIVSPQPLRGRLKNSPLFEKIQANLALSPTALNPEMMLHTNAFTPPSPSPSPGQPPSPAPEEPLPISPMSPCSPPLRSPLPRLQSQASVEEVPVSFEKPAEGIPLPSVNKCRARLSFKRRPPTRQHRKSASEDPGLSPTNGDPNATLEATDLEATDVFDAPTADGDPSAPLVVKENQEEGEDGSGCAREKAASGGEQLEQEGPLEVQTTGQGMNKEEVEEGGEEEEVKEQQQEQDQGQEEVAMEIEEREEEQVAGSTIEDVPTQVRGEEDVEK